MKDRSKRDLNEITGKNKRSFVMNNRVRGHLEIIKARNFERRGHLFINIIFMLLTRERDLFDSKSRKSLSYLSTIFESFLWRLEKWSDSFFEDSSKSSYEIKSRCVIAAAIFITFKTVINCMVNFVTTFMCFSCFEIIYNL